MTAVMRRILIIEDHEDCRDSLVELLRTVGHEVVHASSGAAGFQAALTMRPDVLIIDLGLPDLDGCDVARALRNRGLEPVLIAVTGWGRPEDRTRALDAGFHHFLLKPFDPAILESVILEDVPARARTSRPKRS